MHDKFFLRPSRESLKGDKYTDDDHVDEEEEDDDDEEETEEAGDM